MCEFEKNMMVGEIKGLLSVLEREVKNASFQLASDNLNQITDETSKMRAIINRIEDKINTPEK